jgi:hypothetical protein
MPWLKPEKAENDNGMDKDVKFIRNQMEAQAREGGS